MIRTNLKTYPSRLAISAFLLLTALAGRINAQGNYQTQNFFIIAIDGIRNNEAFESGNLYMKYLWDSPRPQGTIYTNFRNSGVTGYRLSTLRTLISPMLLPEMPGIFHIAGMPVLTDCGANRL